MRAYRTLLWLYPPSFRHEYGDHMVAALEDMLRDGDAPRVWMRVVGDAATSIPILHTEAVMATRFSPNIAGLLSLLFFAVALTALMVGGTARWALLPGFGALVASAGFALYWRSHWRYVEESALHHRWYWFLAGGAALLGGAVVGSGLDLTVRWEILIGMVLTGWSLVAVGVGLGLWNGFAAFRRSRDNGAWPAS